MKVWLTNGRIAWEIPGGRITRFFLRGDYLPPQGWLVTHKLDSSVTRLENARRAKIHCPNGHQAGLSIGELVV